VFDTTRTVSRPVRAGMVVGAAVSEHRSRHFRDVTPRRSADTTDVAAKCSLDSDGARSVCVTCTRMWMG